MFLTGPKVVKTVTHENVTVDQLGGANVHMSKSGVASFAYDTEDEAIENGKIEANSEGRHAQITLDKIERGLSANLSADGLTEILKSHAQDLQTGGLCDQCPPG